MDLSFWTALAHPCIGAGIGYLTNRVAIRMLFRPLRPWRILGVRLPLTPGVIPSQRHALAVNIGEMVGQHLLTSADIGGALATPSCQDTLAAVIDRELERVLAQEPGPLPEALPPPFQTYWRVGIRALKRRLAAEVNRMLADEAGAGQLARALADQLDFLESRPVDSVFAPEHRQSLSQWGLGALTDMLCSERSEQLLGERLCAELWRAAGQMRTLEEILPEPVIELLRRMLREQAPELADQLADELEDPRLRGQLVQAVLGGIDRFLASLGLVGAMAGGFLERDRDRMAEKIGVWLAEKKDEVRAWLHRPEMQDRMIGVLDQGLDTVLKRPLAELLQGMEEEGMIRTCRELAAGCVDAVRGESGQAALGALVREGMEELCGGGTRSLGSVGRRLFAPEQRERMLAAGHEALLEFLRSERGRHLVGQMVSAMVDGLAKRPVGALGPLVSQGLRRNIGIQLRHGVNRILSRELPGLIDALRIQEMVTEKLDGLDLLQLEQLLLSIMQRQFKYINWFGGLLGFLLGLLNLVLANLF
ncbi:MAG: DUF445 domain-containing protein [Desulfobulbus sp.]|jgi:uncharacterized membrane protein YheB (UPF0754 family)